MKPFFTCLLIALSPLLCVAQMMTPSVTDMAGFDLTTKDVIVTVSVGEPAVMTLSSPTNSITQGFLQPEILPCKDLRFNYYPNPATDDITIEAHGCDAQIAGMEIIDMWGRLLTTAKPAKDNKVDLKGLSQGVYVIRVILNNNTVNNINIVKLSH